MFSKSSNVGAELAEFFSTDLDEDIDAPSGDSDVAPASWNLQASLARRAEFLNQREEQPLFQFTFSEETNDSGFAAEVFYYYTQKTRRISRKIASLTKKLSDIESREAEMRALRKKMNSMLEQFMRDTKPDATEGSLSEEVDATAEEALSDEFIRLGEVETKLNCLLIEKKKTEEALTCLSRRLAEIEGWFASDSDNLNAAKALAKLAKNEEPENIRFIPQRIEMLPGGHIKLKMTRAAKKGTAQKWNMLYRNFLSKGSELCWRTYTIPGAKHLSFEELLAHIGLDYQAVRNFMMLQEAIIRKQLRSTTSIDTLELHMDPEELNDILREVYADKKVISYRSPDLHRKFFKKAVNYINAITDLSNPPFMQKAHQVLPIFDPYTHVGNKDRRDFREKDYSELLMVIFNNPQLQTNRVMLAKLLNFGLETLAFYKSFSCLSASRENELQQFNIFALHKYSSCLSASHENELQQFYRDNIFDIIANTISSATNPLNVDSVDWLIEKYMKYCDREMTARWINHMQVSLEYSDPMHINPYTYMFYGSLIYQAFPSNLQSLDSFMPKRTDPLIITNANIKEGELYFRGILHIIQTIQNNCADHDLAAEVSKWLSKFISLYPVQISSPALTTLLTTVRENVSSEIYSALAPLYPQEASLATNRFSFMSTSTSQRDYESEDEGENDVADLLEL